jgi:MoaA/NifB/PqqE/SkfB family radical SAM enzyme
LNIDQFLKFTKPLERASLVQLYGWGEPFKNKEYERMFDHVIERYPGIRIYISTNGVLLTDHWINKLLSYGKCLINVSVNAATERTYEEVMRSTQFQRVVDNIQRLMKARKDREVHDLVVTLSFVAVKQNVHELSRFVELCGELNVNQIMLQDMRLLGGSPRKRTISGQKRFECTAVFRKGNGYSSVVGDIP